MREIRHIVNEKMIRPVKPITEEEKKICDMILCGESVYTAYTKVKGLAATNKAEQDRYNNRAKQWVHTKRVQKYLAEHRKTVRIIVEQDMEALAAHIYDIAMGNDLKTVARYDKDIGGFVKDQVPPSHTDQIAAAAWMKNWYDDRAKTQLLGLTDEQARQQKQIEDKAMEFLSIFKGHKIQDGVFKETDTKRLQVSALDAQLDRSVERLEAEGRLEEGNTNPEVVRKMVSTFARGDEAITDRIMENYAREYGKSED